MGNHPHQRPGGEHTVPDDDAPRLSDDEKTARLTALVGGERWSQYSPEGTIARWGRIGAGLSQLGVFGRVVAALFLAAILGLAVAGVVAQWTSAPGPPTQPQIGTHRPALPSAG